MGMSYKLPRAVVTALGLSILASSLEAQRSPIHGAWRLIWSSLTSPDSATTNPAPKPGLLLFTDGHYSMMYVEGGKDRQPFKDPRRPTDAERLAAFDSFTAMTGTYTLVDTVIAMNIIVSKMPNLMGTELRSTFGRFAYRLVGDTLWMTRRTGPATFTMKLLRVE